ncbi:hypothetical protein [Thermofilum pendens]|uniref:DUF499 domain-containing protein n=1 Tax=Thermofilum pendens (strain DSM 2475 / Hrk 5) TaxID=368408 RepID=A1RYV3_THEPD|nr:hypothetical protein [Thermofilum pendens]ABL78383.1 hypothetical protein Tpen_0983 [Thermofilum pendens Hrk 5]
MSLVNLLAEGKVSPAVDIYEVYKSLFKGEKPEKIYEPYCDPRLFFQLTFVTDGFKQYLGDFLSKLASGESEVYVMPALLGAGKSHFLAFVLHILRLYRDCRGAGECVEKALEELGVKLKVPSLEKVPEVLVFHGEHNVDLKPLDFSSKDTLKASLKPPVVLIFDETQHFEAKIRDFPLLMQMLAEAVEERRGVFLFVSFSLFSGERPDLAAPKSLDAVRRVHYVTVSLDVTRNIVEVFRRWAGLSGARSVELAGLKGIVTDERLREFENRLRGSYPFNPYLLDAVLQLADESLVEKTRVQLTRGLLRILASAYVNRRGELVIFADLPEPKEVVIAGDVFAGQLNVILRLYEDDARKVSGSIAALSVLRHILLATFFARLLPHRRMYPTEEELILGSYDPARVKPLDVKMFLEDAARQGLHIEKVNGRYMYWFIGGIEEKVRDAMYRFGDDDGLEVATDEVASLARERAGPFSSVVIAGVGGTKALGKVKVVSSRDEWEKELKDQDKAILAIDLLNFGVPVKRNNLIVVRRYDEGEPPQTTLELLKRVGEGPRTVREAVVDLGRLVKGVDEVYANLIDYFPELLEEEMEDILRRELEQLIRGRLENLKSRAKAYLRESVGLWLRRGVVGFKDVEKRGFDELVGELVKDKRDRLRGVVKEIFTGDLINWDSFKKVGDLWSLFLNNESFPAIPASFEEFLEALREYCKGCNCLFEEDGEVKWLGENGCVMPELDKDVGVAPFMYKKRVTEWAVEGFLKQYGSSAKRRVYIVYRKPSGPEARATPEELLSKQNEWIYLEGGRLEIEEVQKGISVSVDGVETVSVERPRGATILVEVESSYDLKSIEYTLNGVKKVFDVKGKRHAFNVKVPGEPGRYVLKVRAVFADDTFDERDVAIIVRGKCKRKITVLSVSVGEEIVGLKADTAQDGEILLRYFRDRGVPFKATVSTEYSYGDEEMIVNVRKKVNSPDDADKLLKILKAIQALTPNAEVTFEFMEPQKVDEDMEKRFRGLKVVFSVEREEEC